MQRESIEKIVNEAKEELSRIFKRKVNIVYIPNMIEGYVGVCRNGDPVLFGTQKRVHFYNDGRSCKISSVYDRNLVSKVNSDYDVVKIISTKARNVNMELTPTVIWQGNQNEQKSKLRMTRQELKNLIGRDFEIVD